MINCTAHDVNIIDRQCVHYIDDIRKYVLYTTLDEAIISTIPKSGIILSAQWGLESEEMIDGFSVINKVPIGVMQPPEDENCIVSQLYASAYRKTDYRPANLFCVGDPVYATKDGKQPLGVLNLQRA